MSRIIRLALAGLCAGLLLVIAAELVRMGGQNDSPSAKVAASIAPVKARVPPLDMEAAVAEILERPLFSPERRPPEMPSVTNSEEISEAAPAQFHGRLAGVMIRPGTREALFARTGQKPIAVKIGAEIDGWTIAAIEPDRVILSSDFGKQVLKPTHDPEVVRPPAAATRIDFGMGPPTKSTKRGAVDPAPSTRPSPQSSQVAPQVEQ